MPARPHFTPGLPHAEWLEASDAEQATISDPHLSHHEIEHAVWRSLMSLEGARFFSLTVRRTRDGICLQGTLELAPDGDADALTADIDSLVHQIATHVNVANRIVIRQERHPRSLPR